MIDEVREKSQYRLVLGIGSSTRAVWVEVQGSGFRVWWEYWELFGLFQFLEENSFYRLQGDLLGWGVYGSFFLV